MATVSPSEPWSYVLELPRDPRAVATARTTVRSVLHAHHLAPLADTATLLASELLTNAYLHTAGPFSLHLRGLDRERVRVTVRDTSRFVPAPFRARAAAGHLAEAGRGLALVRAYARDWGAEPAPRGTRGKALWFELVTGHTIPRSRYITPVGCADCVSLENARRAAAAAPVPDPQRLTLATVAIRSHFRNTHILPQRVPTP
ncbi:hypothetical protein GCM10010218_15390 [Streptomyces mashuensis]|uniref:Histidine kinase/HSP90-like ATPase domain-containing protein n=1 Tax=Streptomyces mashuensis TaxID=33904 RepID=A0A919B0J7_9ACTN|nr:ATP-binding protein [Streptomyces mashuensis]GHF35133.1 hypothetical protein GCM10010218_15390 [Streptomyces mashuensis]